MRVGIQFSPCRPRYITPTAVGIDFWNWAFWTRTRVKHVTRMQESIKHDVFFECFCKIGSEGYLNRPSQLVVEKINTYRGRWIIPCCAWVKPNTNTPTAVGIDFSTLKYVNFGVALEHWKINTYRGRRVGIRFAPCRTGYNTPTAVGIDFFNN